MPVFPDSPDQGPSITRLIRRSVKRTNRSSSVSPIKLLLSDPSRIGFTLRNTSDGPLFLDIDSRVSIDDHMVEVPAGGYFEMPFDSTLELWGVWESRSGSALIREFI